MCKRLLIISVALFFAGTPIKAQELIANPGAENTPLGTGWTIIAGGGSACAAGSAAATYTNWTMVPDGGTIYPAAHGGTHTFFPGCSGTVVPGMVYELRQNIDVSADATAIDGGFITYAFSGYIQTPVANPAAQGDAGRFVVDFLNSSNAVIGTSYTSAYQSRLGGSGTGWLAYTNTRLAPAGTRTVRVRLQATLATTPAINVYFDDISLIRVSTLPVTLVSFSGKDNSGMVTLRWSVSDAVNFDHFEIEKSVDASRFDPAGSVPYQAQQADYSFSDTKTGTAAKVFYRLKMVDQDGRFSYSPILMINRGMLDQPFSFSPNPATSTITLTGMSYAGQLIVRTMSGARIKQIAVNPGSMVLQIGDIPKGIYLISYEDGREIITRKLIRY